MHDFSKVEMMALNPDLRDELCECIRIKLELVFLHDNKKVLVAEINEKTITQSGNGSSTNSGITELYYSGSIFLMPLNSSMAPERILEIKKATKFCERRRTLFSFAQGSAH